MKLTERGTWYSPHFSMICLSVKICSEQDLLGRKPACSSRSSLSTTSRSRLRITWQYTFPGIESRVTPRQLSQSERFPFLGMQTTSPFFQSTRTMPEFHTWLQRLHIQVMMQSPPPLSISAVMPSNPGDLLFFSDLTALLISASVKSSVLIGSW